MHQVARADEALPFAAVATAAALVCVDDLISPADGIAALLRYAPTDIPEAFEGRLAPSIGTNASRLG